VEPDVMTLAKALANGVPIGAMLCRNEAASVLTAGSHGSTFGGTPFVCSVALATLTTMIGEKLPERAARFGRELMDGLRAMQSPLIKTVRGRGFLIGAELTKPAAPIMDACRDNGLLVLTAGEKVLRLAPPFVAGSAEITRALQILKDVLAKAGG
jgi:acetylornithine/succinyldiaminopimelate/putrescine aminotransferase